MGRDRRSPTAPESNLLKWEQPSDLTPESMPFQWDPDKAESNLWKHRISFEVAITVFADPQLLFTADPTHSNGEEREWAIGETATGQIIVVVFTMRQDDIRIISARPATHQEISRYESGY